MAQLLMLRPHLLDLPANNPLPPGYELRLFGPADLQRLTETLSSAFEGGWDDTRVRTALTEAPDVQAVYVVAWQGYPVATASSRLIGRWSDRFPNAGYVHWVGTRKDHTGKGLGSVLVARVLEDFIARGYQAAVLETDDERLPALKVYLKSGFVPVYDVDGEDHRDRWSAIFQHLFRSGQ